jgi:hypothetical protein
MFGTTKPATAASDRTTVFSSRLSAYESTVKICSDELKAHIKKHKTAAASNKQFGDRLGQSGRLEHFDTLKELFAAVGVAFDGVATERIGLLAEGSGGDELMARLEATKKGVIEPTKALLADRNAKVKVLENETKKFEGARAKAGKDAAAKVKKLEKDAAKNGVDGPTESAEDAASAATEGVEMPETLLDATDTLAHTDALLDENIVK